MILLWLGIDPRRRQDQERLGVALQVLMAEDATLAVRTGADGTVMIGASDENRLDGAVDTLVHRFDIDAAVTNIGVAYKETVTARAEGESRYAKQSGGRGQYAHVRLRVEPGEPGSGRVFLNPIVGGAIPERMMGPIEEGVADVIDRGVLAGCPLDDIRVSVLDGSYHDADSSPQSFKIAGALAFLDAARRARPVLLEPIMNVSVVTPVEYENRVVHELRERGAPCQTLGEHPAGDSARTISTRVPLSQMFGFGRALSARTDREATCTMTFSHYAPVIRSEDDGDRAADVRAPLQPRTPPKTLRASVPEPRDPPPTDATATSSTLLPGLPGLARCPAEGEAPRETHGRLHRSD